MFSPRESLRGQAYPSIKQLTESSVLLSKKKFRWPPNTCEVWKWSNSVEDIKAVGSNLS